MPGEAAVARPTSDPNVGLGEAYVVSRGLPRTSMEWEVQPDGLRRLLESLHTEYTGPAGIALYVTENGSAYDDEIGPDGSIDDVDRTSYLVSHLAAVHQAVEAGADVRGYFTWSLLDNFEWAYGYAKRFGIVRVDFETLERTPKASAHAYGRIARSGCLPQSGTVCP
jgi:beta-glucosidase